MIVSIPCPGDHDFDLEIEDEAAKALPRGQLRGVVCPTCEARLAIDATALRKQEVTSGDVETDADILLGDEVTHTLPPVA
jgi:ribosomal protein L40E